MEKGDDAGSWSRCKKKGKQIQRNESAQQQKCRCLKKQAGSKEAARRQQGGSKEATRIQQRDYKEAARRQQRGSKEAAKRQQGGSKRTARKQQGDSKETEQCLTYLLLQIADQIVCGSI